MIFVISILFLNNIGRATDITTKYTLESPGMYITIDSNMIELISGIKNKDERLNDFQEKEEYLKKSEETGIVLDAVEEIGENNQREIMVIQSNSKAYLTMPDLNQFTEEDLNEYYTKFISSIRNQASKTQISIQEEEIYYTQNGNTYFHITSQGEINKTPTKLSTYYTIRNQKLVTIGFRYFNTEQNQNEKNIIEEVTFENLPRDNSYQEEMNKITKIALSIILIFIIIILAIRYKDSKQIDKNIKDKELKGYLKFGGILSLLWIILIYQIYLRISDITEIIKIDGILVYKIIILIECIIALLINLYIAIRILIRKPKSVKHITIGLIANGILLIISTVTRIIAMIITSENGYTMEYYSQEFYIMLYNITYTIIWIGYIKISQRVKIYYGIQNEIHYYNLKITIGKLKDKLLKKCKTLKENRKSQEK